jgi:acyl-CoA thioesterase
MWRHIERRLEAPHGRAGGGKPEWNCWVRLVESIPADDFVIQAARAMLWMDMAPWNAVLLAHGWPTTHIAPTLDLTVQFQNHLYAPHVMASDWLLVATASPIAAAGLLGAQSTLWSEAGELLAVGTAQSLCVPNPRHPASVQAERTGSVPQHIAK